MKTSQRLSIASILALAAAACPRAAARVEPLRRAEHAALPGAAVRQDQGHRLPAGDRGGHEGRSSPRSTRSPTTRRRPPSTNTIVAMEKLGRAADARLRRSSSTSTQSEHERHAPEDPEPRRRRSSPRTSDAIYLNPKLFARVKAIYDAARDARPRSRGEVPRRALPPRLRARRRGALRRRQGEAAGAERGGGDAHDRVRRRSCWPTTTPGALVVSDKTQLAGLDRRRRSPPRPTRAKERKLDGKWVFALQNTTQQPALGVADGPRAARSGSSRPRSSAATTAASNDTTAIVARLAQLRAQKARLLGFPTYAAYVLDDQMAKTPQNADQAA